MCTHAKHIEGAGGRGEEEEEGGLRLERGKPHRSVSQNQPPSDAGCTFVKDSSPHFKRPAKVWLFRTFSIENFWMGQNDDPPPTGKEASHLKTETFTSTAAMLFLMLK